MKKTILVAIAMLFLSSCATQTFSLNSNARREVPVGNPHFSKWNNFFISGIGQGDFKNAADLCQDYNGIAFVEVKQNVGQVILSGITYGIYTPRTMNIYCNKQ